MVIKASRITDILELAEYYACDVCGAYHPEDSVGDCDDPKTRFSALELDELHPEGWAEV